MATSVPLSNLGILPHVCLFRIWTFCCLQACFDWTRLLHACLQSKAMTYWPHMPLQGNPFRFTKRAACKPVSIGTSSCLQACFDLDKFTAYKHASIGQHCFLRTQTFDWKICFLRVWAFDWALASFELACFDHKLRLRKTLPSNKCVLISLLPLTQYQISFARLCCVQIFT